MLLYQFMLPAYLLKHYHSLQNDNATLSIYATNLSTKVLSFIAE
ncbi:MAG: hypothetical protein ACP5Q5_02650 [Brevinematia bacterium]